MDSPRLLVSEAQMEAASLLLELEHEDGGEPDEAIQAIAGARRLPVPVGAPLLSGTPAAGPRRTNGHAHAPATDVHPRPLAAEEPADPAAAGPESSARTSP